MKTRDEVRVINDFAEGLYGNDLIYFIDPFAMDKNILPQYWAAPMLGASDAPLLAGESSPSLIASNATANGYPASSAVYNLLADSVRPSLMIPIPPGHSLWLGAHGTNIGGGRVTATPYISGSAGSAQNLTILTTSTMQRVNTSFNGDTYDWVSLELGGTGGIVLTGVIGQILPNGVVPQEGGFISGQGHSGCAFATLPQLSQYSVALDKVSLSINLVETGAWL